MKVIRIVGENYTGSWRNTRIACRAIVIREGKLLLSCETGIDQWMLPGGGLEAGESGEACVVREVAEETGYRVTPSPCLLEIEEYYQDWKWVNRYYRAEILGETGRRLTEKEKETGLEPRWLPMEEALRIFASYPLFAGKEEMRGGMYRREYMALRALTGKT